MCAFCNICILLLICSATTASLKFRADYTYHTDIAGWLKLHQIPATWYDARELCYLEGAVLASPDNEAIKSALRLEMSKSAPDCGIYTGINAINSKGYFYSIEGIPLEKMPLGWLPEEPDNVDNKEDCIAFVANGSIADVNCSEVLPFVCYKKSAESSIMPCGTIDREYEYVASTGSCYKFHTQLLQWGDAFKVCSAEGAYLAIINSQLEASVLKDLFAAHSPNDTHNIIASVGFYIWKKNGVWRTVHGQTLKEAGYSVWERAQPDDAAPGQFCGAMFRSGKLDDYWCSSAAVFVCEKDPTYLAD